MSPEQLRGEKIDRRTDVFAMGILLYMMTTGKHPFRGDDQAQTIARISAEEPAILPSTLVPGYPPGLEAVVMQALAKDPAKRYPSANDMLIGLTRALPPAMRESTDEEVSEFIRRLLPDRLERQKQAIKQALEQADRREMSRSAPQFPLPETATDEAATVLEGIGREMTPSADGRSLPGASSSEPPPSLERAESQRRRNLLALSFGGILLIGGGLGFAFGRDDRDKSVSAGSPPRIEAPLPTGVAAEPVTPSSSGKETGTETVKEALAAPEPPEETSAVAASATPSAGVPRTAPLKRPTPSTKASGASSAPARQGPFVSPIRNPGF
jgi:serine/threonine-protein kinase